MHDETKQENLDKAIDLLKQHCNINNIMRNPNASLYQYKDIISVADFYGDFHPRLRIYEKDNLIYSYIEGTKYKMSGHGSLMEGFKINLIEIIADEKKKKSDAEIRLKKLKLQVHCETHPVTPEPFKTMIMLWWRLTKEEKQDFLTNY